MALLGSNWLKKIKFDQTGSNWIKKDQNWLKGIKFDQTGTYMIRSRTGGTIDNGFHPDFILSIRFQALKYKNKRISLTIEVNKNKNVHNLNKRINRLPGVYKQDLTD